MIADPIEHPVKLHKYQSPLLLITSLVVSLLLIIIVLLFYQNMLLKQQIRLTTPSPAIVSLSSPVPSSIVVDPTTNWKTYTNTKYGFAFKYPSNLNMHAVDYNIQGAYKRYVKDCDSGKLGGCGGSRWPDYEIMFVNNQDKLLFSILIDEITLDRENTTKNTNTGFSYSVVRNAYQYPTEMPQSNALTGILEDQEIQKIASTLKIVNTDKPLTCLWTPDTQDTRPTNNSDYEKSRGYYFNPIKNTCDIFDITIFKGADINKPFDSINACTSTCL